MTESGRLKLLPEVSWELYQVAVRAKGTPKADQLWTTDEWNRIRRLLIDAAGLELPAKR